MWTSGVQSCEEPERWRASCGGGAPNRLETAARVLAVLFRAGRLANARTPLGTHSDDASWIWVNDPDRIVI